ncbi:MAG: rhomboid family intramembrane serine protease [Erysipelotrichia bacterium]|nr:rhomboid family intramembrane serine protease [Candidatus Riflebacteria bacterium]NCB37530.1 rhomboid family intramembrane serine protease [Erysipelotrichia bacterium]
MFFPLHDQNNEAVRTVPIISYAVIGLCLLIHLLTITLQFAGPGKATDFLYRHAMVPMTYFSGMAVMHDKPESPGTTDFKAETPAEALETAPTEAATTDSSLLWIWLMPFTCIFIHANWMHLLTNLWFFWIFADNIEEKFGSIFFMVCYALTGYFSSLTHALLNHDSVIPMIGASGAISGIMGAYMVTFPRNRITSYFCPAWFFIRRLDVPAIVVLGFYLLLNTTQLLQKSGVQTSVAVDAHISGFITGVILAYIIGIFMPRSPAAIS